MPTIFSDCDECHYLNWLDLDHKYNKKFKEDLEKNKILINLGLPNEISEKIIKLSNNLEICDYCINNHTKMCLDHCKRAIENSIHYRKNGDKKMCDRCCWWEIS